MEEVAKQVYVETAYDGVNVGALVTPTGVICIDVPSYARDARDWAARMHRLSPYPVLNIILTDSNGDRVLNTRWLNAPIIMQQNSAAVLAGYDKRFPPHLIESLSARNPQRGRELSTGPIEHPTMSFSGEMVMFRHGQQIVFISAPGPNPGTAWIDLPDRNVIFVGDTLMDGTHPLLTTTTCGTWIDTLNALRPYTETHIIVPGRGPILNPGTSAGVDAIDSHIEYLETMRAKVVENIQNQLPVESLVSLIPEFMAKFPLEPLPADWVRQQIKNSLGNLYDEVQSGA